MKIVPFNETMRAVAVKLPPLATSTYPSVTVKVEVEAKLPTIFTEVASVTDTGAVRVFPYRTMPLDPPLKTIVGELVNVMLLLNAKLDCICNVTELLLQFALEVLMNDKSYIIPADMDIAAPPVLVTDTDGIDVETGANVIDPDPDPPNTIGILTVNGNCTVRVRVFAALVLSII